MFPRKLTIQITVRRPMRYLMVPRKLTASEGPLRQPMIPGKLTAAERPKGTVTSALSWKYTKSYIKEEAHVGGSSLGNRLESLGYAPRPV